MRRYLSILLLLFLFSCQTTEKPLTAEDIVNKAIEKSKVDALKKATLTFDFRQHHYTANRSNGIFKLERITKDSLNPVKDILSNDGFQRYINDSLVSVADSMAIKYSESVNSVHYFSVLPLGLNDAAVNKKRLEDIKIQGKEYYKIEITFDQEGGGVDFEDVFVYWINKESYHIDYLAYLFHVNGGGVRFRKATTIHNLNGIRLADYDNYKPNTPLDVRETDVAFENNGLTKVSEINLENIRVTF